MRAMLLRVLAASALLVAACVAGGDPVDGEPGDGAASPATDRSDSDPAGSDTAGWDTVLDAQQSDDGSADDAPAVGEVVYRFDWDLSGVDVSPDGGVTVTNDLGYQVEIDLGYLVSFSTELVECPVEEEPIDDALEDAARMLRHMFGMGVAHAGHGDLEPNPAKLTLRLVERVHAPAGQEVGRVALDGPRYCQIHYLAGKTMKDRQDPAEDVDMIGRSLYLEGRVTAPGAESSTDLLVDAAYANGVVLDLPASDTTVETGVIDTAVEGATVTLSRELATLFDGVDFGTMTEAEAANQIMKSLVAGVSVSLD